MLDKTSPGQEMQEKCKVAHVDPPADLRVKPKIKQRTWRMLPGLEHKAILPVPPKGAPGALVLFRSKVVHSMALPVVSPCAQVCLSVIRLAPRVCTVLLTRLVETHEVRANVNPITTGETDGELVLLSTRGCWEGGLTSGRLSGNLSSTSARHTRSAAASPSPVLAAPQDPCP